MPVRTRATMTPRYVSFGQAAQYLQVSTKTIRRMVAAGELPVHRLRKRLYRIDLVDLDAFIEGGAAR